MAHENRSPSDSQPNATVIPPCAKAVPRQRVIRPLVPPARHEHIIPRSLRGRWLQKKRQCVTPRDLFAPTGSEVLLSPPDVLPLHLVEEAVLQLEGAADGLPRLKEHPPTVGRLQRPLEQKLLGWAALGHLRQGREGKGKRHGKGRQAGRQAARETRKRARKTSDKTFSLDRARCHAQRDKDGCLYFLGGFVEPVRFRHLRCYNPIQSKPPKDPFMRDYRIQNSRTARIR